MVATFFKNHTKQLERGENAYTSGNVQNMFFESSTHPATLKGDVCASMKNKVYKVEVRSFALV